MGIEIEKKYRLTGEQKETVLRRLSDVGAKAARGEEFEVNTLYAGNGLELRSRVLRLRRVGERSILTYKERVASASAIKHQREDETGVEDGAALAAILDALGYRPALLYEKRRTTWLVADVEVVVDELPFGLFMEIEGAEHAINEVERLLELSEVEAEHASYPELTQRHGTEIEGRVEARFERQF